MTHPDILNLERFGERAPQRQPRQLGVCGYCGAPLYSHRQEQVESADSLFCDMECCHAYYEISSCQY